MRDPHHHDKMFARIFADKAALQGALLCNLTYGIEMALFAICIKLLRGQVQNHNLRVKRGSIAFMLVLFVLSTICLFSCSAFAHLAFIDHRNFPGGPSAYEVAMFGKATNQVGMVAMVIGNWLMDLLLVWRCTVVFSGVSSLFLWTTLSIPCLLFLASLGVGTLFLIRTARTSPYTSAADWSLAYFSLTFALNIVVTALIAARLLTWRLRFGRVLGAGHVSHYANVAAILIESASLYSLILIPLVVTLALKSPLASLFICTVSHVQSISALLIVYRIVTGQGWACDTSIKIVADRHVKTLSSIQFAPPECGVTTHGLGDDGAKATVSVRVGDLP